MTPFLADKQNEFSLQFEYSQERFHNNDWSLSFSDILSNFQNLWQDGFNFYIISPFANVLDELDILNFVCRLFNDFTDIVKNICWIITSSVIALLNLMMLDFHNAKRTAYQTLQCIEKVLLNTLDIMMNIVLFVLSPIARLIATPIWYAQTPETSLKPY